MALETQLCCHRARPKNLLTECGIVAYGKCADEHIGTSGYFCFDHLVQCRRCGKMYCPTHIEAHRIYKDCEQVAA